MTDNPWASKDGMEARDLLGIQAPEGRDQLFWDEQEEDWSLDGPFEVISISPSTATAILNMHAIGWLNGEYPWMEIHLDRDLEEFQVDVKSALSFKFETLAAGPTLAEALIQAVIKEKNNG